MEKYRELLKIARKALESELNGKKLIVDEGVKKKYATKQACFVTLSIDDELRGCIGSLSAHQELWKDVIDNAVNAGFNDTRFNPISREELKRIKIEISVLSSSEKLGIGKDVYDKIDNKMGIILKKGWNSATFLPQVWEQIPDKKEFLEHLSRKAGLLKDYWKDCEISFYRVESVKE
ncbi:MAG: AmmeMemoRadiSam system protein A [Nanoarchaeota archaeon]